MRHVIIICGNEVSRYALSNRLQELQPYAADEIDNRLAENGTFVFWASPLRRQDGDDVYGDMFKLCIEPHLCAGFIIEDHYNKEFLVEGEGFKPFGVTLIDGRIFPTSELMMYHEKQ